MVVVGSVIEMDWGGKYNSVGIGPLIDCANQFDFVLRPVLPREPRCSIAAIAKAGVVWAAAGAWIHDGIVNRQHALAKETTSTKW